MAGKTRRARAGPLLWRLTASTGRSIFLLMTAFTAFWGALAATWWAHTERHLAEMDVLSRQELEERARRILALEEEDLFATAFFLADDLHAGHTRGDAGTACASLPPAPSRGIPREQAVAILDHEGRPVATRGDPALLPAVEQLLAAGPDHDWDRQDRKTFFARRENSLIHAMVLPSREQQGAQITGWVVTARRWDDAELARLEGLIGGSVRLAGPDERLPDPRPGTDRVEIADVLRSADGKSLGTLVIEVARPRLQAHRAAAARNSVLFGLFAAGGIVLLGFLLRKMVCRPVALILEALRQRNPAALDRLVTRQTDMGELARLVQDFFRKEAELHAETDRLRQSREELKRLYAAIEHSPDTIVITDLNASILYANPAFEKGTGYRREEALGKNPRILKSGLHGCNFYKNMWASLQSQGYWSGEITNRRKNGSLYIEYAAISRIQGPDGEPIGYVAVKTDITERKRAEFELRRHATELEQARDQLVAQARELTVARDRALEAVKARSEFLARISHELRTPLNGIIGMLDVMMLTGLSEEQHECASAALDSAKKLLTILTDIIEFSRLESETLELCEEETGLREILEEAWDSCREEAAQKGIRLAVTVEDGVPAVVSVDRQKLLQALDQLCRNAVKFTVEGEASLRVSLTETRRGSALRFEVADTGVGIPAERLEGLFEPFHQPEQFSTRRFRGTGLGLAIVRKLVEFWGGEVGVESEPGKGSRFHFTVPLKQAGQRAA
jgi:PAS domain S-box-containing protein